MITEANPGIKGLTRLQSPNPKPKVMAMSFTLSINSFENFFKCLSTKFLISSKEIKKKKTLCDINS